MIKNYSYNVLEFNCKLKLILISRSNPSIKLDEAKKELLAMIEEKERSLNYNSANGNDEPDDRTKEILEKIQAINEGLRKPYRPGFNFNLDTGGGYYIDKETVEKIKKIIASGKHGTSHTNKKPQDTNTINNDDDLRYSRAIQYAPPDYTGNTLSGPQPMPAIPYPYITTMPVIVMPSSFYGGYSMNNDLNSLQPDLYQSKQRPPSVPFQIPWPLAPFFPILVKDPLLHYLGGGSWDNLLEYGQNADVCNRRQKSAEEDPQQNVIEEIEKNTNSKVLPIKANSRQGRAIKKRAVNVVSKSVPIQDNSTKKMKKIFSLKASTTQKPKKQYVEETQNTKATDFNEGDLRFPFSDFTWFGNRKPVAPSPGFFINRLKVRRGGVAIAGPGGVATAGKGGTAIVGPGGLAYTQPGGVAVAGPAARVVALSQDLDLSSIVSRLQQQSAIDGSIPRLLQAIPEGKVVATGPIIYYHPYKPL